MSHAHPPAPTFARQIAYTLVTLGAMILAFVVYTTSEKAIDAANEARLRTFLLADELHQSSDDLTRMARLYVVSEHPHARQYHQRILETSVKACKPGPTATAASTGISCWSTAVRPGPTALSASRWWS